MTYHEFTEHIITSSTIAAADRNFSWAASPIGLPLRPDILVESREICLEQPNTLANRLWLLANWTLAKQLNTLANRVRLLANWTLAKRLAIEFGCSPQASRNYTTSLSSEQNGGRNIKQYSVITLWL